MNQIGRQFTTSHLRQLLILTLFSFSSSIGQIFPIPDSAHVNLYFPHFTDGGPSTDQWQTKFTFVNPNQYSVPVSLYLYGDDGHSLRDPFSFISLVRPHWSLPR